MKKAGGNDGPEKFSTEVEEKMNFLKETYGVSVSEQAKKIIGESVTAIAVDAHRSWPSNVKDSSRSLRSFQADMLNALPATLANFAGEQKLTSVTSFDLLHGMTRIVDHLCPFMKPPP